MPERREGKSLTSPEDLRKKTCVTNAKKKDIGLINATMKKKKNTKKIKDVNRVIQTADPLPVLDRTLDLDPVVLVLVLVPILILIAVALILLKERKLHLKSKRSL